MKMNFDEIVKYISNCDDIYCPYHEESSCDSEHCVHCFEDNYDICEE